MGSPGFYLSSTFPAILLANALPTGGLRHTHATGRKQIEFYNSAPLCTVACNPFSGNVRPEFHPAKIRRAGLGRGGPPFPFHFDVIRLEVAAAVPGFFR